MLPLQGRAKKAPQVAISITDLFTINQSGQHGIGNLALTGATVVGKVIASVLAHLEIEWLRILLQPETFALTLIVISRKISDFSCFNPVPGIRINAPAQVDFGFLLGIFL